MSRKATRGAGKAGRLPPQQQVEQLVGLCRARRFGEAAPIAREFTRKWPRQAVGWHALAACAQAEGRLAEAIRAYREALKLEPDNADGHNNLGLLLAESGAPDEAVKSYRRALRIRPGFGLAHYNLGLALEALEQWKEAADSHRCAIELDPGFAEAHNHLGNVLRRLGRPAEAADHYRRVLKLQPRYAEVYSNLGNVLAELGDPERAETCLRRSIELRPDFAEAYVNLGHLLRDTGRLAESEVAMRRAVELRPEDPDMLLNLAVSMTELGQTREAVTLYREAVERRPDHAETRDNLGNALADLGEVGEAADQYRRALSIRPGFARARYHLALVKRFERDDPDRDAIEAELKRDDLEERDRICLEYAAGKAWADLGDAPACAFDHYRAGARLKRASLDYDVERDEAQFDAIARTFTAERLNMLAGAGLDSEAPVFIVGMPRSGTSLIEQMLASHPRVHGMGERSELSMIVDRFGRERREVFPSWVESLSPKQCAELGRAYHGAVVDPVTDADRVTDKMPSNFVYLGLIRVILPGARVIHVRRDPVDTCLSCFTYLFAGRHAVTYDLAELGRYYRAYDRLMAHWRETLPDGFLLELRYEDLVEDPRTWVARMLEHCGLEWDDACLEFHRSERAVRTASAQQVRQPLYRGAIGRWRAYREQLGPLFEALGPLAPPEVRE